MGQFSVEIYALPGSLLSGNQQRDLGAGVRPHLTPATRQMMINTIIKRSPPCLPISPIAPATTRSRTVLKNRVVPSPRVSPRLHHHLLRCWFVSGNRRQAAQKAETVTQRWDTRLAGNRRKRVQKQRLRTIEAVSHDCDTNRLNGRFHRHDGQHRPPGANSRA